MTSTRPALPRRELSPAFGLVWVCGVALTACVALMFLTRGEGITNQEGDGQWLMPHAFECANTKYLDVTGGANWPWLWPWIVRQVDVVVGDVHAAGRWVSVACCVLWSGVAYSIARRTLQSVVAGVIAGLIVVGAPETLDTATMASNDLMAAAVLALALPSALRVARGEGAAAAAAFAGLASAAATMVRFQMFAPALALGVVLIAVATSEVRARVTTAFAAAFVGPHLAASQLPWVHPYGAVDRIRGALAAMPSSPSGADLTTLAAHYAYSAQTFAWVVGYLPLLGGAWVAVKGVGARKGHRAAAVLLVPAAVTFLSVGWFPSPPSLYGRLFLACVLPVAVATAALAQAAARAPGGRLVVAAVGVMYAGLDLNQIAARFPMPLPVAAHPIGFDPVTRVIVRWDGLGVLPEQTTLATERLEIDELRTRWDPVCAPVLTDSMAAAFKLPLPLWLGDGPDSPRGKAVVADAASPKRERLAARWVLARRGHGDEDLVDGLALDDAGTVLRERDGTTSLRLFEVVRVGSAP